jgi:hypothetical protein
VLADKHRYICVTAPATFVNKDSYCRGAINTIIEVLPKRAGGRTTIPRCGAPRRRIYSHIGGIILEYSFMRTRILFASAAALLTLASTAYAATLSGIVSTYMPEERVLVLENGYQFTLSFRVGEQNIAPGDRVQIVWNGMKNGKRVANAVTVVNQ